MPQDLLTSLPVAPELLWGGLVLLVVFVLLRRITAAFARRRAARVHRAAQAAALAEAPAQESAAPAPDPDLPGVLYPMPVISHVEARLFDDLQQIAGGGDKGYRVMMQLSLNTFMFGCASGRARTQDPAILRLLAQMQVDFLFVDAEWQPVLALDLAREDFAADEAGARKRTALERAGVAHMTIAADGLSEMERDEIRRHLGHLQGVAAE